MNALRLGEDRRFLRGLFGSTARGELPPPSTCIALYTRSSGASASRASGGTAGDTFTYCLIDFIPAGVRTDSLVSAALARRRRRPRRRPPSSHVFICSRAAGAAAAAAFAAHWRPRDSLTSPIGRGRRRRLRCLSCRRRLMIFSRTVHANDLLIRLQRCLHRPRR